MIDRILSNVRRPVVLIAVALAFAGTSGFLTSQAVSGTLQETPARTVTLNVATGATGPAGPRGPAGATGPVGPAGTQSCPAGSTFGKLVINHPGGHVSILTCIVD